MEERLIQLSQASAIDPAAYAVMRNPLQAVLHINAGNAQSLTPEAVCERWRQIHNGMPLFGHTF